MRTYGQYCGVARALELVGERWALLVVRDLLLGPKRFGELRYGLPRIPSNILSARLKELEHAGVIQRSVLPLPATGVVYELTEHGRALDPILVALGAWGVSALAVPRPDDWMNSDSLGLALRDSFRPDAAHGVDATFEVHLGESVAHAYVHDATVDVERGPAESPDLLIVSSDLTLGRLIAGDIDVSRALATGRVVITGTRRLFQLFAEIFRFERATA
jgi:DNA-binding HxlR family transcriptional regulator/putative sterol carrier protein